MKRCPDCGTPLDEVPLAECRTHRLAQRLESHADHKRAQEDLDDWLGHGEPWATSEDIY